MFQGVDEIGLLGTLWKIANPLKWTKGDKFEHDE